MMLMIPTTHKNSPRSQCPTTRNLPVGSGCNGQGGPDGEPSAQEGTPPPSDLQKRQQVVGNG
jgi:hypothetical protein